MKKVIRLTEADIGKIVQKVIAEQGIFAYNQLVSKVAGSNKGKAVQGSDNDLTTLVTLLPNKPSALDQKTHPRKSVLPPIDKIYSIKTANNGDLDFFRFKPGGYFNRHNWVVQTQGGKSRLGTFDVNGKKIYFKKFGVPQNQWYKDEGFTEVIDLGSLSSKGGSETAYDLIKPVLPDVLKITLYGIPNSAKKTYATSIVYHIIDPKTGAKRYHQFDKSGKTLTAKGNWKIENNSISYEPNKKGSEAPKVNTTTTQWVKAPSEQEVIAGTKILKPGAVGDVVTKIQQALGFTGRDLDGKFGNNTFNAVKKFQQQAGLEDNGVVGSDTYTRLFRPRVEKTNIASKELARVAPILGQPTSQMASTQTGVDDFS